MCIAQGCQKLPALTVFCTICLKGRRAKMWWALMLRSVHIEVADFEDRRCF